MEDTGSILARCPYFRGVPPQIMHLIAGRMTHASLPRHTVLCVEETEADAAWILGRGVVEARKALDEDQFELLATMKSGTLFGHVSLLDGKPRSATLVCATPAELVRIERDDFRRLVQGGEPAARFFRRAIILALGDTLLAAAGHVKELTQKDAAAPAEDTAKFLRNLREKLQGGR